MRARRLGRGAGGVGDDDDDHSPSATTHEVATTGTPPSGRISLRPPRPRAPQLNGKVRRALPAGFRFGREGAHTTGVNTPISIAASTVRILPWADPLIDVQGHDPRGAYAERFWLSVIGPTASWIMRRFADLLDAAPEGIELDLVHTASTMGLSYERGVSSPFGRALNRCVMFGLAHQLSDGFAVRRRLPDVAARHLARLPPDVQAEHAEWRRRTVHVNIREIERRLCEIGISPAAAARACEAAALAS